MGTDSGGQARSLWDSTFQFNPANFVGALIVAFLVAALSAAVMLSRPAKFQSTATIAIDQPSLIASGGDRVIDKLSRIRVKYAPLLTTDVMTGPLAQELGTTPANIRSSVSATTPVENLLILVTARTGSSSQSQRYASKAAELVVSYAKDEQVRNAVPADQQYQLTVVDQARSGTKVEPSSQRAIAVTVAAGLIAAALAYVVLQLVRPRTRPPDET